MTDERSKYLYAAAKFAKLLNEQKMTAAEYAYNLLQQSALESCVDDDIARTIVDGMPLSARQAVSDEIRAVLTPGFQVRVHIGGPGPGPLRMARINAQYTKCVQAWASAFARLLGMA